MRHLTGADLRSALGQWFDKHKESAGSAGDTASEALAAAVGSAELLNEKDSRGIFIKNEDSMLLKERSGIGSFVLLTGVVCAYLLGHGAGGRFRL